MSYTKQNFKNGQVLTAEHLNKMENGIADAATIPTASVGQTIVVEEVDASGKPTKWKAADFQERTHWSEVVAQADIVPNTIFTPTLNQNFGCTMHPVTPFELEVGKSYTVIFDGVEYDCTAFTATIMDETSGLPFIEVVALGNSVFAGGANNGMPFAVADIKTNTIYGRGSTYRIVSSRKDYMVLCMDTQQHTVQVVGEKLIHHEIPQEYASDLMVRFALHHNGGVVMVTPWDAIISAINADRNIYGMLSFGDYEVDASGNYVACYKTIRFMCTGAACGIDSQLCEIRFVNFTEHSYLEDALSIIVKRDENGVTTTTTSNVLFKN